MPRWDRLEGHAWGNRGELSLFHQPRRHSELTRLITVRFPPGKLGNPVLWTVPIWLVACGLSRYVYSPIASWVDPGPIVLVLIPIVLGWLVIGLFGLPQLGLAVGLFMLFINCIPLGLGLRRCYRRCKPWTIAVACVLIGTLVSTYTFYSSASRIYGVRMVEAMGGEVRLARLAGEFSFGIPTTVCWVDVPGKDLDDNDLDKLIRALDKIGVKDCRVDLGGTGLSEAQRCKLMNDGPASHLNYSVPRRTRWQKTK